MTQRVTEISLEPDLLEQVGVTEDDIELLKPEELDAIRDDAPHLVILIPGIRTNGWWAQEASFQQLLWDGREVHFIPVRGNGRNVDRLSSMHLFARIGLQSFRDSFVNQIKTIATDREYATINVFAHSMGSALFADIVESLHTKHLGKQIKIGTVAFIGSVCHRKHSSTLSKFSKCFVNDVGVRDFWPYIASTVRPDSYSDVGFAGFLDAFSQDRFFPHNHTTCTSLEHIRNELVPLISAAEVRPLGSPMAVPGGYNRFIYIRRGVWVLGTFAVAWLLSAFFF